MAESLFNQGENQWLNFNSDNHEELEKLYNEHHINKEIIEYALDPNERAHIDYDKIANVFVLIYNVPHRLKIDNHYETIPMTFIIKEQTLITVTNNNNHYIYEIMKDDLHNNSQISIFEFLFGSLFMITDQFFPYMDEMDKDIQAVSNKLKIKTSKTNLLSLSDLETGIVFFISASRQNEVLLEQLKNHMLFDQLTAPEKEELKDAQIEAKQLVEMTQLSSQILHQLSGTYNNILNNNLNETMRILTVLSVLLTIPTIITGFFGMNMPLPLENNAFGWLITIVISVLLWFALSYILRKLMK